MSPLDVLRVPPAPVNLSDTFDFQQMEMRGVSLAVDPDARARIAAAIEAGRMGASAAALIPFLIEMLDQDRTPRGAGDEFVEGLGSGTATTEDGRMIENIARISEADLACHVAAQEALARIGESAVSSLVDALKVPSDNRRIGSAKALGEIGLPRPLRCRYSKHWRKRIAARRYVAPLPKQ